MVSILTDLTAHARELWLWECSLFVATNLLAWWDVLLAGLQSDQSEEQSIRLTLHLDCLSTPASANSHGSHSNPSHIATLAVVKGLIRT